MKMKASRKLIPAIAMLLVSAVVLSTASYAWFTMSRTVTATGVELTASAPTNLLISSTSATADDFAEAATAKFAFPGLLYPASTQNGTTFYAPEEVKAADNGAVTADSAIVAVTDAVGEGTAANSLGTNGYYVDFKFWLKTTGGQAVDVTISQLTDLTKMLDTSEAIKDSVRIAVLDNATGTPAAFTGKKYMWNFGRTDTFLNKSGTDVVGPIGGIGTDAWKGAADSTLPMTDKTAIFTCPADGTAVPIVIRVWIEGQDAECIAANAGDKFTVQVGFSDVDYTAGLGA